MSAIDFDLLFDYQEDLRRDELEAERNRYEDLCAFYNWDPDEYSFDDYLRDYC